MHPTSFTLCAYSASEKDFPPMDTVRRSVNHNPLQSFRRLAPVSDVLVVVNFRHYIISRKVVFRLF